MALGSAKGAWVSEADRRSWTAQYVMSFTVTEIHVNQKDRMEVKKKKGHAWFRVLEQVRT